MKNEPFIEKQILTRIINNSDNLSLVSDRLRAKHFSIESYQMIYGAIIGCFSESAPIDILQIKKRIKGNIDIMELLDLDDIPHQNTGDIDSMANHIIELWTTREAESIALKIPNNPDPITYGIEALTKLSDDSKTRDSAQTVKEILPDSLAIIEARMKAHRTGEVMPDVIRTDDEDINNAGVLRKQEITVIGARPGMGKSTYTRELVLGMAKYGAHVRYYSIEMSKTEITNLFLSHIAEVNSERIRNGNISNEEHTRILKASTILSEANIEIDGFDNLTNMLIDVRKWRAKIGYEVNAVLVVDYLQQISNEKPGRNREQEITSISTQLMNISKPLDLCIIEVAQLSRAVESRGGDKRPIDSDLRESGSLEQDANSILFLYCPFYYGFETDDEGNATVWRNSDGHETGRKLEVIISKNRGGRTYTIWKQFQLRFGKTLPWDGTIRSDMIPEIKVPEYEVGTPF